MPAKTISIALQKGGTGKTTTAQALASTLGHMGRKVLLVDMDSQANATAASGAEPELTILSVLSGDCTSEQAIMSYALYDLIASEERMANFETFDPSELDKDMLKKALSDIKDKYDYLIIDTPPLLGNILRQCLTASDYVIIPVDPRPFALNGLDDLYMTIQDAQIDNPSLNILGILLIKYNDRTILNRQISKALQARAKYMGTAVFQTRIRDGIAVPEAQLMRQPLITYAPTSKPCLDYVNFTNELLKKVGDSK